MKVLICGVGKITRHLLRRLGESWQITLIDKSEERLSRLIPQSTNVHRVVTGDASSPVLLDEVGIADFDYVLALTDNDKVNRAVVSHAAGQGVDHCLALVSEQENRAQFHELPVRTVLGSSLLAQNIFHYLQDPRIRVTPLAVGDAEMMEIDVSDYFRMVGKRAATLMQEDWKLVAIFRGDQLLFPRPDTLIELEDRLMIVGRPGIFKPVCDLLECGHPHFPLAYGQGLLLALNPDPDPRLIIKECMHLAQNTKIKHLTVYCSQEQCAARKDLEMLSQSIDIQVEVVEDDLLAKVQQASWEKKYGLVVIDPFKSSFFGFLPKPVLVSLAHALPCPLLIARHSHPYEQILVPFNGTPKAVLGLEVAVDLARQLGAEISVVVVEEPEFIHTEPSRERLDSIWRRVREIAHIHKVELKAIQRNGNPVREIVALAKEYNLIVMGSATKERNIFRPHVGELLAQQAPCSVLIVAN